jgi:acyl-CoA dehydrogenase
MISFEMPKPLVQTRHVVETVALNMMRPVSRQMDENEHEIPWSYIQFMHTATKALGSSSMAADEAPKEKDPEKEKRPPINYQRLMVMVEMLSWGDAGIYLCTPGGMLGAAAISAAGTSDQKKRFLSRFSGEEPVFDAMAMTEPQAGSDTSAIRATAVLDKESNEWVLNGEKIFVTAGHKALVDSKGFIVVWASLDLAAGRAGIRSFVIEAGTPGCKVTKLEEKLGIRASDTVSIVLQDCRVPYENILGSPTIEKSTKGYKGAMETFDATRPIVAASALGVARAALDFIRDKLAEEGVTIHYGLPRQKMTNLEREFIDMETQLRAAWLLTVKALWMADNKKSNALVASMSKVKAGKVATIITQKAVEMMGPLGYSREFLLEKWFRDAKINDIFEGTGQINLLVVARNLLGYRGSELR